MNKKSNMIIGAIILLLGVYFLLHNLNIFRIYIDIFDIGFLFSNFWPMFLIIPGFFMHMAYFSGKNTDAGILVPGGILLVSGLTCQLSTIFGNWHVMWPGFLLAVAVGLFELYLFGPKEKGLLIPVGILGGLSFIFFSNTLRWYFEYNFGKFIIPLILILLGGFIIYKSIFERKEF